MIALQQQQQQQQQHDLNIWCWCHKVLRTLPDTFLSPRRVLPCYHYYYYITKKVATWLVSHRQLYLGLNRYTLSKPQTRLEPKCLYEQSEVYMYVCVGAPTPVHLQHWDVPCFVPRLDNQLSHHWTGNHFWSRCWLCGLHVAVESSSQGNRLQIIAATDVVG